MSDSTTPDSTTALCEHAQHFEAPAAAEVIPPRPDKPALGLPSTEPAFDSVALEGGLVLPVTAQPVQPLPAFAGSAEECSLPEKEVVYDDDLDLSDEAVAAARRARAIASAA